MTAGPDDVVLNQADAWIIMNVLVDAWQRREFNLEAVDAAIRILKDALPEQNLKTADREND